VRDVQIIILQSAQNVMHIPAQTVVNDRFPSAEGVCLVVKCFHIAPNAMKMAAHLAMMVIPLWMVFASPARVCTRMDA